mmetsp:Transcript_11614/g.19240  ORF Transcript_11614/g.19240 Transcript_11614/m.19240 type:complete len:240 (-) Transcript_11614:1251-1970(-)
MELTDDSLSVYFSTAIWAAVLSNDMGTSSECAYWKMCSAVGVGNPFDRSLLTASSTISSAVSILLAIFDTMVSTPVTLLVAEQARCPAGNSIATHSLCVDSRNGANTCPKCIRHDHKKSWLDSFIRGCSVIVSSDGHNVHLKCPRESKTSFSETPKAQDAARMWYRLTTILSCCLDKIVWLILSTLFESRGVISNTSDADMYTRPMLTSPLNTRYIQQKSLDKLMFSRQLRLASLIKLL